MSPPAFIDANVPIYASGRSHPLKEPCLRILRMASERPLSFFTDAEVLQELLHRYLTLRVWPRGGEVIRDFSTIMRGRVEPIRDTDVEAAVTLADDHLSSGLSARDLLHAVVIARIGATEVISADKGFNKLPELELLDPKDFDSWRARLEG